jgi:hypothetical protein
VGGKGGAGKRGGKNYAHIQRPFHPQIYCFFLRNLTPVHPTKSSGVLNAPAYWPFLEAIMSSPRLTTADNCLVCTGNYLESQSLCPLKSRSYAGLTKFRQPAGHSMKTSLARPNAASVTTSASPPVSFFVDVLFLWVIGIQRPPTDLPELWPRGWGGGELVQTDQPPSSMHFCR